MIDNWTFGRKIAAGFALSFVLLLAIGSVSYRSISKLTSTSQWVTHTHEVLERIATAIDAPRHLAVGHGRALTADRDGVRSVRSMYVDVGLRRVVPVAQLR